MSQKKSFGKKIFEFMHGFKSAILEDMIFFCFVLGSYESLQGLEH